MNPGLALHRSLTFWAGILVIIFTCWAWRDSCHHESRLQWNAFSVDGIPHAFLISHNKASAGLGFWALRRAAGPHSDPSKPREVFPLPFLVQAEKSYLVTKTPPTRTWKEAEQSAANAAGPGSWSSLLPYWLIVLALLII